MERVKQANIMDREKRKMEAAGERSIRLILRSINAAATGAFLSGNDPVRVVVPMIKQLRPVLVSGLVASHLSGRRRAMLTAAPQMRANGRQRLAGTAYDDARDFLAKRLDVDEYTLQAIAQKYSINATQQIEGLERRVNDELVKAIKQNLDEGSPRGEGLQGIRQAMSNAGLGSQPWAVRTLFTTNTALAYSAGRLNANDDPAIQEILWGYEYMTAGDDRVRPNHVAMDGAKAKKDDGFWKANMPPNGWNCRCVAVEIFDQGETKLPNTRVTMPDGTTVQPEADPGWNFNPGAVYRDYLQGTTPSTQP